MTNPNTNPDYYKAAEKTALVRLCGVLGILTENNDLAAAALLAATRIERLEKKIPALNVDLAEASMHAYNGEIERLEHEIAKCKEANEDAQSRLDDYRQDYEKVVNDLCPTDERHCGCVPILRRENRLISEELADAKDELKHRRDALIDAQRIYNKANEQKVHYLSALQFIASFVNAKDKTTVDDLIAIAGKEIDAEGDQIVDACNYWVSKLREAEDKLQDAQLKPKTVYTVTMYRYGNREWHSYVLGAFSSNDIAREWAAKEEEYRGGKYKAEIIRWGIDSPTDFLKGEL